MSGDILPVGGTWETRTTLAGGERAQHFTTRDLASSLPEGVGLDGAGAGKVATGGASTAATNATLSLDDRLKIMDRVGGSGWSKVRGRVCGSGAVHCRGPRTPHAPGRHRSLAEHARHARVRCVGT